jgi:hypothetical protein
MLTQTLVDETFDKNQAEKYKLSFGLSAEGCTFAVLDESRNKYIAFGSIPFASSSPQDLQMNLEKAITNEELLQLTYKKSALVLGTSSYTMVPEELYQSCCEKDYLAFNTILEKDVAIIANPLPECKANIIFSISEKLKKYIESKQPAVCFLHSLQSFMNGAFDMLKRDTIQVFCNINPGSIDVILVNSKKLMLANTYPCTTEADVLYHLLNIYKQFDIIPAEHELILAGQVPQGSNLQTLLANNFKNARLVKRPDRFLYSYKFDQITAYQHFTLLNALACV